MCNKLQRIMLLLLCISQEVNRLRALPSLIILDLAGNPLASSATEDYRLWLLYSLRRLKVLDGQPVEQQEQIAARARYSGRLTLSFLVSKDLQLGYNLHMLVYLMTQPDIVCTTSLQHVCPWPSYCRMILPGG